LLAVLLRALRDGVLAFVGFGGGFGDLFVAGVVEGGAEADVDGKALTGAAFIYSANGRNVAVVAAISDANVAKLDGHAERGVETDPTIARQKNLGPGMRSLASDDFFLLVAWSSAAGDEIAGDVARGQTAHADNTEQKVSEILADACT